MPDINTTIIDLPTRIELLKPEQRRRFQRIFQATLTEGRAVVPPLLRHWAQQRFGDLAAIERQQVVRVRNLITLDEALFNPLRARRPIERRDGDLEREIAERLSADDLFADPWAMTTADPFGRISGRFCLSASNIAKFDGWHGLVIFDEPHPLRFGVDQVIDYLDVALRWLHAAHAADPAARYPLIIWNCLPRSGATIVHGHLQMTLTTQQHYAQVERWHRAALAYAQQLVVKDRADYLPADVQRGDSGSPHFGHLAYFADLLAVHTDLRLTCYDHDGVVGFASLTPARNREIVLLAAEAGPPLATALAMILRALIDGQGVRAFNVALYLPPLGETPEDWRGFTTIARVADRGDPLSRSSDLGAVEVFASNVITADPFEVARLLRTS